MFVTIVTELPPNITFSVNNCAQETGRHGRFILHDTWQMIVLQF